jgi:hypothetical protein
VAVLVSDTDARWQGPVDPAADGFIPGSWKLVSGVAELRTTDGASVTLQAPSEFTLRSSSLMDLQSGVLSAHVPREASGFTVKTAAGRVVDIGTRFGVRTSPASPTETHVFTGHVQVAPIRRFGSNMLDLRGGDALALDPASRASRRFAADPSRFPRSSATISGLLIDGGWEPGDLPRLNRVPTRFGVWGGDDAEVIGDWRGVKPHDGKGMLRLTSSFALNQPPDARFIGCEQWQFVDLQPYAREIKRGGVVAEASMWLRQVGGEPVEYRLRLAGFASAQSLLGPGLAVTKSPRMTDSAVAKTIGKPDASDWQSMRTRLELPPSTLFVYVSPQAEIGANADLDPDVAHLVDSVEFKLSIPPRPEAGQ